MPDLIGKNISNRYRVDSLLGRGGMGDVYKVWDSQRGVFLAMKVLHADLAEDKVFLRRFAREAETLSALQHPHIVRFYGLEQEGRLTFMLMDYVEGTTLRGQIFDSSKPFTVEQVLQIVKPVCSALHYAHQMGRVHCDIKPANIMVKSNGDVLVADFGIARMMENSTTTTMVGAGTPAYMAPEQVLGKNPVPQTDIYALGIVLYEMLTGGERPFTGEQAQTDGSTSEKVRWEQITLQPPSLRKYNPDISPQLEAVVSNCLQKKPEDRYADAFSLLNALSATAQDNLYKLVDVKQSKNQPLHKTQADDLLLSQKAKEESEGFSSKVAIKTSQNLLSKLKNPAFVLFVALLGYLIWQGILSPIPENPVIAETPQPTTTATFTSIPSTKTIKQPTNIPLTVLPSPIATLEPRWITWNGTSVPWPQEPLNINNANRMVELAGIQIGHGWGGIIKISPNDDFIAYALGNNIYIMHMGDGVIQHTLEGHTNNVDCLEISPNGHILASVSRLGEVRIWDAENGVLLYTIPGTEKQISSDVKFSPDGIWLAGSIGDVINIWKIEDGTLLKKFNLTDIPTSYFRGTSFSPDGSLLAYITKNNQIHIWNTLDGSIVHTIDNSNFDSDISTIIFSQNGKHLTSVDKDGMIQLWSITDWSLLNTIQCNDSSCSNLIFLLDEKGFITATGKNVGFKLKSITDGALIWDANIHESVSDLVFSSDGTVLASLSYVSRPSGSDWTAKNSVPTRLRLWGIPP